MASSGASPCRSRGSPPQPRVEDVPEAVPGQIEPERCEQDCEAGERREPPITLRDDAEATLRDHRAPLRVRGLNAEPEKTQCSGYKDNGPHVKGRVHEDGSEGVRQDVAEHDAPRGDAD